MVHPLKNILNKLRWDERENPENYLITYRHRGAPDDAMRVRASKIERLGKSYFTLRDANMPDEESTIPFHRILEIRSVPDNRIIWVKKSSSRDQ